MSDLHIDTTVYEGRPADETGRLPKEIHTYDLLDRLSIPFVRVDHEAAMTIEACQGVDALLGMEICKNLFLCNRQKTQFSPAAHARQQALPHERAVRPDRFRQTFLRLRRIHGAVS